MGDQTRHEFLERLKRIVSGAIKQVRQAHGDPVDAGSVAKRIAAELWARTGETAHPNPAAWVRHVRGQLGLTQEEFAGVLGVRRETVTRWENRERSPKRYVARIEALAQQLPAAGAR
ncbi:MAG: helix-turn-helix transcriptional regulator [Armatimonadetes bacterium]|nr:helix-turn-helix transcriptional regulator [Armatimonadota bacterium]